MTNYSFESLNDKEFEALAVDLLSAEFGVRIERFKPGKDKGVDGRWYAAEGGEAIVQCKHWLRSGVRALINALRNVEVAKVNALMPDRYVFVTSLPLSRANKQEILTALAPHIRNQADVLGADDVNGLLARHPIVEKRHYKLWLASATVLQQVLNGAIIGRSAAELRAMYEEAAEYAVTENHIRAAKHLQERHVLLLSGEPGVGKTTLARQLCLQLVGAGYQLVCIEDDLSEAEAVYADGERQVFYFDDFLGRTLLESMRTKEDSHLLAFMRRIARDPLKRFVLTSRTNILNQAKVHTDLLREPVVEGHTYELRIGTLSVVDRGRILYTLLWYSRLDDAYTEELFRGRRYRAVVKHKSYNPRLIRFVLDVDKVRMLPAGQYWEYVTGTLNNPRDVWEHFFASQISQECRDLVYLTVVNGDQASEAVLRTAFLELHVPRLGVGTAHHAFGVAVRHAVGSVLDRRIDPRTAEVGYALFNPSIADYVQGVVSTAEQWAYYFRAVRSVSSLSRLQQYRKEAFMGVGRYCAIIGALLDAERRAPKRDVYAMRLAMMALEENSTASREFSADILDHEGAVMENADEYMKLLVAVERGGSHPRGDQWYRTLADQMEWWDVPLDHPESMSSVLEALEHRGLDAEFRQMRRIVVEAWKDHLPDAVRGAGILDEFYSSDDTDSAESKLESTVDEWLAEAGVILMEDERRDLCRRIDVEAIIEANRNVLDHDDDERRGWSGPHGSDGSDAELDDLFDRTEWAQRGDT